MWVEVVKTAVRLFDSPAPLKVVGAPFCSGSPGFMQSQRLLSQAGNMSCLSHITSCSLVLNVLVTSVSPSCQKEPILWKTCSHSDL